MVSRPCEGCRQVKRCRLVLETIAGEGIVRYLCRKCRLEVYRLWHERHRTRENPPKRRGLETWTL